MHGIYVIPVAISAAVIAQLMKSVELVHSIDYVTHALTEVQIVPLAAIGATSGGLALWRLIKRRQNTGRSASPKPRASKSGQWFLRIFISIGRKR